MGGIANHPVTQSVKDTVVNGEVSTWNPRYQTDLTSKQQDLEFATASTKVTSGPVAENLMEQHAKTTSEFQNLANARTTPASTAATGQPLTRMVWTFRVMEANHIRLSFLLLQPAQREYSPLIMGLLTRSVGESSCHHDFVSPQCHGHFRSSLPSSAELDLQGALSCPRWYVAIVEEIMRLINSNGNCGDCR